ncbi:MAG: AAA family ATPase [Acidimicrobiia bacterium]
MLPAASTPPLVGRSRELAWLDERLDDALAGKPQVLLITGEAGIGKSRLLRELQRRARARGADVCPGRCREGHTVPYLPFLRSFFPRLERACREDGDPHGHAELIARLSGRPDQPTGGADPSPEQEQAWLFFAVAETAVRLARRECVLVTIDDLQWADPPSVDLLYQLVVEIADAGLGAPVRLCLAATMRPPPEGQLAAAIARVQREEICNALGVGGLDEGEAAELVRALGLERSSRQLISSVHGATRGNPLHIEAVVQQAAGSGAVRDRGGELVADPAIVSSATPADVGGALDTQIDRLGERGREVLTLASFLDEPVSAGVLAELAHEPDVAGAIADAVEAGVVISEEDEIHFAHPLFAHLLRRRPDLMARRQIHLAAADVLERAADLDESVRVHEVAHHLIEAGPVAAPDRTLEWAQRAGDRSWSMLAWGDAARCFEAAGRAAEEVEAPAAEIANLLLRSGVAHYRAMAFGPSSDQLERSARFAAVAGDARGLALARLEGVRADIMTRGFGAAVDVKPLEEALDALTDDPALAGRLLTQIAEAHWVQGDLDKGRDLAARALELARGAEDDATCARALVTSAVIAWLGLDLESALGFLVEACDHATRSRDPWVEAIALPRLALTLLWLGRLDEAEAAGAQASHSCREVGDWAERSLALSALVGVAAARGDFEAVERWAAEAWTAVRLSRYVWSASLFLPTLAATRALRGAGDEAAGALDRLTDLQTPDAMSPVFAEGVWLARQLVRVYMGEIDDARAALRAHPERITARWGVALGTVARYAVLAELADIAGVEVPVDRIERALARAADRGMIVTDGLTFVVARVRALTARLDGREGDAERHLLDAITVCEQAGARPELARSSLAWARLQMGAGDADAAEPLAARAAGLFRELGMAAFARTADEVARQARGGEAPDLRHQGTVVVAFFDVAGSTATTERIGDRAYRTAAAHLEAELRGAVVDYGGQAIEGITLGDGILAVFRSAGDAIACARRVHEDVTATPLRLHVGIHAGDVLWSEAGVHGGTVNIAARVCDRAGPGETFVTDTIRHLARTSAEVRLDDRGLHDLKGLTEPLRLFAVRT